jgi:hypothetical protein
MTTSRRPISAAPDASSVPILTMAVMNDIDRIRHGFFTRQGGVSTGLYAGLNVGYGSNDEREKVAENRSRAAAVFGIDAENLLTVHQYHSAEVVTVTETWTPEGTRDFARYFDRRLRAGPICRWGGRSDRSGPCRLERR